MSLGEERAPYGRRTVIIRYACGREEIMAVPKGGSGAITVRFPDGSVRVLLPSWADDGMTGTIVIPFPKSGMLPDEHERLTREEGWPNDD